MRNFPQTHSTIVGVMVLALGLPNCKTSAEETVQQVAPSAAAPAPAPGEGVAERAPVAAAPIDVDEVGFATPESVLYDAAQDIYLVSNINGKPTDKDDNGFIARVRPDGTVATLKWIDGGADGVELNAPKGMAVVGGLLYVADIDRVRLFDRSSGAAKGSIEIPGGTFVNDLVAAPDGTVYASDSGLTPAFKPSGSDAIWKIVSGTASALIKDEKLGRPNGLALDGDQLVVVTFGTGSMYRVNAAGKMGEVTKAPKGSLDGIEPLGDGGFLVSSWEAQAVYKVTADGTFTAVIEGLPAPADIGWDSKRARLLIPLFNDNKVLIRSL